MQQECTTSIQYQGSAHPTEERKDWFKNYAID